MRKSSWLTQLPGRLAIGSIRLYQLLISPMLGPSCRFSPSCSHYACACLRDHGLLRGSWLTLRRLSRCHPWHPGGYDPPPPAHDVGAAPGCRMKDLGPAEVARPEHGRGETSTQTPG